jgi:uncharacterized membrane protein YbhN (UPF0104 family)
MIILSCMVVFAAYLILIEAWRRIMRDWGTHIQFAPAAHIWFVSVLGRYLPGRVWSAIAVGIMAKRAGASAVAAVGSALLLTLINTVVGASILVGLGGPDLLQRTLQFGNAPVASWIPTALLLAPLAIVLLLPFFIAPMAAVVRKVARRDFQPPRLSHFSILRSSAACAVAWMLYGVAFWLFYQGLFGVVSGSPVEYVKVYTASYMVGYVAVFAPGGLGARELAMEALLPAFGLASTTGQALVAAWYSRVWLTVLEVLPGVALMLIRPARPEPPVQPDHG